MCNCAIYDFWFLITMQIGNKHWTKAHKDEFYCLSWPCGRKHLTFYQTDMYISVKRCRLDLAFVEKRTAFIFTLSRLSTCSRSLSTHLTCLVCVESLLLVLLCDSKNMLSELMWKLVCTLLSGMQVVWYVQNSGHSTHWLKAVSGFEIHRLGTFWHACSFAVCSLSVISSQE